MVRHRPLPLVLVIKYLLGCSGLSHLDYTGGENNVGYRIQHSEINSERIIEAALKRND